MGLARRHEAAKGENGESYLPSPVREKDTKPYPKDQAQLDEGVRVVIIC